ncbi:hypothetical protein ALC57_12952, partial [Trachymyrmex cornetzi]
KDGLPHDSKENVVYKINCKNCDASYVGQTGRKLKTRINEHKNDINPRTLTSFRYLWTTHMGHSCPTRFALKVLEKFCKNDKLQINKN